MFFFFSLPPSEQTQPPEGLHAGRVHRHWHGRLLVRLHPEPLLQGPHEEDGERPGGPAESRAEPARPAAEVSVLPPASNAHCK